ncbi:hypothetical protein CAEBREN_19385 [Caenorhabditis brenneri]|uniref:Uncharacterized protein n=1 Tax=Caenorhabditis brenneri TaxID=135651 RepID=G0NEJ5_CAEBE|nr:hypothetical protein CAEBREN_19385 [Caenorhabditis brenneri]
MPRNRPQGSNLRCILIEIVVFVITFVVGGSLALYWCSEEKVEEHDVPPTNLVELPDCQCPPFKLMDQDDIRKNTGGQYLRNLQTWDPMIEHNAEYPCWFNIECRAGLGVSSYFTTLFRSNGNPIYINRVVSNRSIFTYQPREIGDFKCAQHTDGSYQWHFHNYPVTDVGFACQADVDSCHCPYVKIDDQSGARVQERFPGALDQCYLYTARCDVHEFSSEDHFPFLSSEDTIINNLAVSHNIFYDDLICIKEDTVFNWYYSNKKLEDVIIKCGSIEEELEKSKVCQCGAFPVINKVEMLAKYKYYQTRRYISANVGKNSWTPSCKFNITCEEGFKGVVFSDNYDPIEFSEIYVTCTFNPLSNDLHMWIVNSVRVINPAGGCFKKR